MPLIIINNANARNRQILQQDRDLVGALERLLSTDGVPAEVEYTTSFSDLGRLLDCHHDIAAVFSNFPPDSTFSEKAEETLGPAFGELVFRTVADSYELSKQAVRALCGKNPGVSFHIIPGAPQTHLADDEIVELGQAGQIIVKRKQEFFTSPEGFQTAYGKYIARKALHSLQLPLATAPDDQQNIHARVSNLHQFGMVRVLLLSRSKEIATGLAQILMALLEDTRPLFRFIQANDVEEAHQLLLDYPIEMVLSILDGDFWFPMLGNLLPDLVPFGAMAIMDSDRAFPKPPPGITPFYGQSATEPSRKGQTSLDPKQLLLALIDLMEKRRDAMEGGKGLAALTSRFLSLLAETGEPDYRAFRWLTVNHNQFIAAVAAPSPRLGLFFPVSSLEEMRLLIPRALFAADRTVFTFLPLESVKEGTVTSITQLWDTPHAPLASLIHAGTRELLLEYKDFVRDGQLLFYPSPLLVQVDKSNYEQLSPDAYPVLERNIPVFTENRNALYHLSADKLNAHHVVLANYRPISALGGALAQLEIPFVDNVPPQALYSIQRDHAESFSKFRGRVQRAIEDLIDSQTDVEREKTKRRFARELQDSTKELDEKLSLLRKSSALQQMGGAVLTAIATLTAIFPTDIPTSVVRLIGGGGLGSMGIQYLAYLMQLRELKKSPYYVVWKMGEYDSRR